VNNNRNGGRQKVRVACVAALTFALFGCSDGSDNLPSQGQVLPQAENPVVTGPVTGGGGDDCCIVSVSGFPVDLTIEGLDYEPGSPFYTFLNYPMAEVGYVETEFFFSGTAHSYIASGELGTNGEWLVQTADAAEYTSRMVVLRPVNAAEFNGTVVVEWFNVSGGIDAAPDLLQMHVEMIRQGYAWVGVSAQSAGIEGGGAFSLPLKVVDPTRYGGLSHPGDSFSYDIFSQGAQAVRNPMGLDPLDGLEVERMIAVGQSQSAGRLATYYNAVHPTIDLFDAFIIHGRGSGGASSLSQEPQVSVPTPRPTLIRTDLSEPVIALQNETDVPRSIAARQEDSAFYRMWEVTGSAHTDLYTTLIGNADRGDDPTFADVKEKNDARPPFIQCAIPVNDGPGHWVANAALAALDRWIRGGEAAPGAPFIEWDEAAGDFVLDAFLFVPLTVHRYVYVLLVFVSVT